MISSREDIDDFLKSSLSLKLYLNLLVYHWNIFGSSSKAFNNLRKSLDIFGNFQKFWENVRERSSDLWNNFWKSSEIFGKWLETFGKSSKTPSLYLHNIMNRRIISNSFAALTRKILFLPLEHKTHIFSPPCNIFYCVIPENIHTSPTEGIFFKTPPTPLEIPSKLHTFL